MTLRGMMPSRMTVTKMPKTENIFVTAVISVILLNAILPNVTSIKCHDVEKQFAEYHSS
jgi:hypothetical protein